MLDGVPQPGERIGAVAQAGQGIQRAQFFKLGVGLDQVLIVPQETILQGAEALTGPQSWQQLLIHQGLVEEVIDALLESMLQGFATFTRGQQEDVGEVVAGLVELAHRLGQAEAVHFRHQPVGDEDARRPFFQHA